MNYEAFVGYWFYGGSTSTQTASFFSSWGLLETAPTGVAPAAFTRRALKWIMRSKLFRPRGTVSKWR